MTTPLNFSLDGPAYHAQIAKFKAKRANYERLAKVLKSLLREGVQVLGVHALVQSRTKTLGGFAEKIGRPGKNYTDPLNEMPDLCGVRVITQTLGEVAAVCGFLENHFEIVREETDNKLDFLAPNQFGYLSQHFEVRLKPGVFPEEKVPRTKELEQGVLRYKSLLALEPKNADFAQELARMARALGQWELAIDTLEPFGESSIATLLRDLGVCLCKRHGNDPDSREFERGQAYLRRATELNPNDVDVWGSLAGSWRTRELAAQRDRREDDRRYFRQQARDGYSQAYQIDQADSYALGNYIEYEMTEHPGINLIPYFRPAIQQAKKRCQEQADGQINLPWAFFDLGKFHLFLQEPKNALVDYAKGVATSTAAYQLDSALKTFATLESSRDYLTGLDWPRRFLEIARAYRFEAQPRPALEHSAAQFAKDKPVAIVAGYCGSQPTDGHRAAFAEAFSGFDGTVISGGTRAGIAELVGDMQAAFPKLETFGYVPKPDPLPDGVQLDGRYRHLIRTEGENFSALEPLQYWRDLLESGIGLDRIRLLAIGGGSISLLEVSIALALGVQVGILEAAEGTPKQVLKDLFWNDGKKSPNKPARLDMGQMAEFLRF